MKTIPQCIRKSKRKAKKKQTKQHLVVKLGHIQSNHIEMCKYQCVHKLYHKNAVHKQSVKIEMDHKIMPISSICSAGTCDRKTMCKSPLFVSLVFGLPSCRTPATQVRELPPPNSSLQSNNCNPCESKCMLEHCTQCGSEYGVRLLSVQSTKGSHQPKHIVESNEKHWRWCEWYQFR